MTHTYCRVRKVTVIVPKRYVGHMRVYFDQPGLTLDNVVATLGSMQHPLFFAYLVWCAVEDDRTIDVLLSERSGP